MDDDAFNLLVGQNYCKGLSIKFDTAMNGKEAIEKLQSCADMDIWFDIILMDINMPVLNGIDAAIAIKKMIHEREIKDLKIIGCSANVEYQNMKLEKNRIMDQFLTKPLKKKDFLDILEHFSK